MTTLTSLRTAALALGVLAATAACQGTDGAADSPFKASAGLSGHESSVLIPSGRLDLTVTDPAQEVASSDAADGESHAAADGDSIVSVGWSLSGGGLPTWAAGLMANEPQTASLTLVADDERYPIGDATGTSGGMHVPVAGDPSTLVLEIEYDGMTQQVDALTGEQTAAQAGAAKALANLPATRPPASACGGRPSLDGVATATVVCSAAVSELPYVQGAGWAAEGGVWRVVDLSVALRQAREGAASYRAESVTNATTLDGAKPTSMLREVDSDPARYSAVLVFPDGEKLHTDFEWDLALDAGTGPNRRTLSYTADRTER